ncbi:oxidoreductase (plasmid) [Sphingomonas aliaeris]|uniref:Oxidoreductase n=1 Tax=Sphingomonas aliaeris TaxID=2759526 RepID=A0A974S737_9SPHN|nr:oxidoreductase [Sphingomonas aliaeris]QQV79435.1 oxidoreductase [Sphingomonas aliaeris]
MEDIGVGLVGYGLGGRAFHAPYIRVTEGLTLRAVVSRDPAKVHADLPGMPVVPNIAELLAIDGIDLVVVSSPDHLHADHALVALEAGKHVLVDKPFATTLTDARRIRAAAEQRGRLLTVFHNRRWDGDFLTLHKLMADGVLGEIVLFESHFDRWRPIPARVWKEERQGGSWLDLGPHLVDQALVLFGVPDGVTADIATFRAGATAPDYFHVILRYPTRRVILHSSKVAKDHDLRFVVHGTKGTWIKHGIDPQEAATVAGTLPGGDDWGRSFKPGVLTLDASSTPASVFDLPGNYRLFWGQLAAAIRGHGPNPVPADEALAVMEVLEAALESSLERREMTLPPRSS